MVDDGGDLLLASGSQDNFIRLWRIAPRSEEQMRENRIDLLQLSENEAEIKVEEKILQLGREAWYAVSLESVLYGHEGWIYGVHWHKTEEQGRFCPYNYPKTLFNTPVLQNYAFFPHPLTKPSLFGHPQSRAFGWSKCASAKSAATRWASLVASSPATGTRSWPTATREAFTSGTRIQNARNSGPPMSLWAVIMER